jgi:hypothetical protein
MVAETVSKRIVSDSAVELRTGLAVAENGGMSEVHLNCPKNASSRDSYEIASRISKTIGQKACKKWLCYA